MDMKELIRGRAKGLNKFGTMFSLCAINKDTTNDIMYDIMVLNGAPYIPNTDEPIMK